MQNAFNQSSVLSEAEQALRAWGVEFERRADGVIVVPGDLNVSSHGLTALPDLGNVRVTGDFNCRNNRLTTLAGAPQFVGGGFNCSHNQLTSLEGAPKSVGNFSCSHNQLSSLKGAPESVGGHFFCSDNRLTSLEGGPEAIGDDYYCHNNRLTSVAGAPKKFRRLAGDFGGVGALDELPAAFLIDPEVTAKIAQEKLEAAIQAAVVLPDAIAIKGPLRFKPRLLTCGG